MSTGKKLTAMQELISRLNPNFFTEKEANYYLEKEKQQIIEAGNQTDFEDEDGFGICETITKGEQYYEETYKNE